MFEKGLQIVPLDILYKFEVPRVFTFKHNSTLYLFYLLSEGPTSLPPSLLYLSSPTSLEDVHLVRSNLLSVRKALTKSPTYSITTSPSGIVLSSSPLPNDRVTYFSIPNLYLLPSSKVTY